MTSETKAYLKELGSDLWYYSSLGFSIALSIMLGTGIGYLLDNHYGWMPVATLIGLTLGIIAGFKNIYLAMKRVEKNENKQ